MGSAMLAVDTYMLVFRIVHIVAGTIWVGSLFLVVVFIQPVAATMGPAGAPFMSELRRRRLVDFILADAVLTVVGGSFVYWHDWHTYPRFRDWISTSFGATLTVGALLALSVIGIGVLVSRPSIGRLVALGRQVADAGGSASPMVAARIAATQRRLKVAERASLVLTLLAVVAMASARYI
ncbi:MAG: hypothetical protein ACXVQJ_04850 [Actinomycetota bacterium]